MGTWGKGRQVRGSGMRYEGRKDEREKVRDGETGEERRKAGNICRTERIGEEE